MKLFNNLNELWDYMLYCPNCEASCRNITVNLGPDEFFSSDSIYTPSWEEGIKYILVKPLISIKNQFNSLTKIDSLLKINLLSNSFEFKDSVTNENIIPLLEKKLSKKSLSCYFYIQGHCYSCHNSSAYSSDLVIDFQDRIIKDILLERETIQIKIDSSEIYNIEQQYDSNITIIQKYCTLDDGRLKRKSEMTSALLNIDFSDLKKAFNRIKTILVFS